jgi:hypothetical protein
MPFSEIELRKSRLKTEALSIGQRYGGDIRWDQNAATWFYIGRFPIGPGWNKTHVAILLDIPSGTPGYPQVAPQWFWTDRDLATQSDRPIGHFFVEGTSYADRQHLDMGWGHFCIHVRSWHPSRAGNILAGDSLLTYLELISLVFRDQKTLTGR